MSPLPLLKNKIRETLPPILPDWFDEGFKEVFNQLPFFLRMCWLKAISGAWSTAVRSSSIANRRCVFGCIDARDSLVHYLVCPVLWQFARETLHVSEPSIEMKCRLCLSEPSSDKFKMLAFCYSLYHGVVNDPVRMNFEGHPNSAQVVQLRAIDLSRRSRFLVGGG